MDRWGVRLLLLLFVLLASLSSVVTPPFETPDELWHYAYIQHLAEGNGLPVSGMQTEALWKQEGGQAPAYYLAAAALTFWIDQSDFPARYERINPHAALGLPGTLGNVNYLLHYPDERWPWRGSILALHLVRFFSVFLGVVTLFAIFRTLCLLRARREALLGTALVAFIPQFIFISGSASNDNAITAAAALLLWRLVLLLRATSTTATPQARDFLVIGFLLGVALLSKLTGLALLPLVALTLVLVAWRARSWRVLLRGGTLVGASALLVAGWWYGRNVWLYGDWLALNVWESNVEARPAIGGPLTLVGELRGLEFSFWGLFGWFNLPYPAWVYTGFRLLEGLVVGGLLARALGAVRRRGLSPKGLGWRGWAGIVLLGWLLLVLAAWASFMRITFAAQGRLFFPALPTVALLMLRGLSAWRVRPGGAPWLGIAAVVALLGLSVATPWWISWPAYQPSKPLQALPSGVQPLDEVRFGERIALEGYTITPSPVAPGTLLELTLYWRALQPLDEPYSVAIKVFGRGGQIVAASDAYPDGGRWPTPLWQPGQIIADRRQLRLAEGMEVPTVGRVTVDLYRFDTLQMLPATVAGQAASLPLALHDLVIRRDGAAPAPMDFAVRPVGPEVTLGRDELLLDFAWEVGQPLAQSYQALFHLVPAREQPPVQQADFEPLGGDFPTPYWQPGDRLPDHARMALPNDLPRGEYLLLLGLYDLASGTRLEGEPGQTSWVVARLQWDGTRWQVAAR